MSKMSNSISSLELLINDHVRSSPRRALDIYHGMQDCSQHLSAQTIVTLLKACASLKDLRSGQRLHQQILDKGLLKWNVFVGSALVNMYATCGLIRKAQETFHLLSARNVVTWNTMIAGYSQSELHEEALQCFEEMQFQGVLPDGFTFSSSLKACGRMGAIDKGIQIHGEIARKGLLETNIFIGSSIVDMYSKWGLLKKAQETFDILKSRNVVTWTALISGYAQFDEGEKALHCFEQMQNEGIRPNAITYASSLKACASSGMVCNGNELRDAVAREGLLLKDLCIGNTVIDMYTKFGMMKEARKVFDMLPTRNVLTWTILISGYLQLNMCRRALACFDKMQVQGISPDSVTFVCSLKACGILGATKKGIDIHAEVARRSLPKSDLCVGSALIDMYAKCGLINKSQEVFDMLESQNPFTWNALITSYAQLANTDKVLLCFDRMIAEGYRPNPITFLNVLNTCSHGGLVDKGQSYFEIMSFCYAMYPTDNHLTCLIDLFGRAGQMETLSTLINKAPIHPNKVFWFAVLNACHKRGYLELARQAFQEVVQLDGGDRSAYTSMSNIYRYVITQDFADEG